MSILGRLRDYHKTRAGLLAFGLIELVMALVAFMAFERLFNTQWWIVLGLLTLVLFFGFVQDIVQLIATLTHRQISALSLGLTTAIAIVLFGGWIYIVQEVTVLPSYRISAGWQNLLPHYDDDCSDSEIQDSNLASAHHKTCPSPCVLLHIVPYTSWWGFPLTSYEAGCNIDNQNNFAWIVDIVAGVFVSIGLPVAMFAAARGVRKRFKHHAY